jgi:hypothetical protein
LAFPIPKNAFVTTIVLSLFAYFLGMLFLVMKR